MSARIRPGSVLLDPEDVPLLRYCVENAQSYRDRNGQPRLARLDALAAAMSAPGHPDIAIHPDRHAGPVIETVSTAEASERLGISERQVRRIAPGLGGRLVGGVWILDALAVEQHREGSTPKEATHG